MLMALIKSLNNILRSKWFFI